MDAQTAIGMTKSLTFRRGWVLEAEESDRFQDAIVLRVCFPTENYNRDQAPDYPNALRLNPPFVVMVGDFVSIDDLLFAILGVLARVHNHEDREALRYPVTGEDGQTTWHAPFHPHNTATMAAYAARTGGDVRDDLSFGVS